MAKPAQLAAKVGSCDGVTNHNLESKLEPRESIFMISSNQKPAFLTAGDGDQTHDLLWHVVKKDEPLICMECGQVFKLVQLEDSHAHHDHDHKDHDHHH
jgi:hypothetical protein